jgi:lipopolysaccharide transport system permease protein/teichoic acid transport system permease protein
VSEAAVQAVTGRDALTPQAALRQFVTCVSSHRGAVLTLARRELKVRYAGTAIGALWVVLPQIVMLFVYWFVFSVGLRVTPSRGVPFVAFFVTGFLPWSLFNEMVQASSSVVPHYAPLVKKTVFPSEVLPISELIVALATQAVLFGVVLLILWFSGVPFSIRMLQATYYLVALCAFSLAVGLLVGSTNVLLPDIGHALGIVLNVWFWLTPIVWEPSMLGEPLRRAFSLNPLFYIVDGYRGSLLDEALLWRAPGAALWFWTLSAAGLAAGVWVFERLKPRFVEAL